MHNDGVVVKFGLGGQPSRSFAGPATPSSMSACQAPSSMCPPGPLPPAGSMFGDDGLAAAVAGAPSADGRVAKRRRICRGHEHRTMSGVVEVREFASAVTPEGHEARAPARPVRLIGVVPVGRVVAGLPRAWS